MHMKYRDFQEAVVRVLQTKLKEHHQYVANGRKIEATSALMGFKWQVEVHYQGL